MGAGDIILGDGVFSIGATPIALTRGGGQFTVEREYREIEADGDYGPVKGRVRKIKSVAKLTLNALEMLPANIVKMYPGLDISVGVGTDTITGKEVEDADYNNTITWVGTTKSGLGVVITLENAINLENIDWPLVDKDEVVAQVVYTATYDESTRTTEPWDVEFAKGTTYTVTFTVTAAAGGAAIVGADVTFDSRTITTIAGGVAAFTGVAIGNNQAFSIDAGGYQTYFGSVNVVNAHVPVAAALVAI